MANAAAILKGWADFAAAGGLDGPPAGVPRELLDMDGRVANEVPALVGVALAIHAAGKRDAARALLSFSAKSAANSPDAVAKIVPVAIGLANWAGAGRAGVLRGLGCVAALALLARDTPKPGLFAGWAAYLGGGGLDRPIDSVPFTLLGGGGASDVGAGLVISAAVRLAAAGRGEGAARLLAAAEEAARLLAGRGGGGLDPAGLPAAMAAVVGAGVMEVGGAAACYAALALWHAGVLRCLDPGHTLRKMAAGLATRFAAPGATYTVGELSGGRGGAALRELRGGGGGEDAEP